MGPHLQVARERVVGVTVVNLQFMDVSQRYNNPHAFTLPIPPSPPSFLLKPNRGMDPEESVFVIDCGEVGPSTHMRSVDEKEELLPCELLDCPEDTHEVFRQFYCVEPEQLSDDFQALAKSFEDGRGQHKALNRQLTGFAAKVLDEAEAKIEAKRKALQRTRKKEDSKLQKDQDVIRARMRRTMRQYNVTHDMLCRRARVLEQIGCCKNILREPDKCVMLPVHEALRMYPIRRFLACMLMCCDVNIHGLMESPGSWREIESPEFGYPIDGSNLDQAHHILFDASSKQIMRLVSLIGVYFFPGTYTRPPSDWDRSQSDAGYLVGTIYYEYSDICTKKLEAHFVGSTSDWDRTRGRELLGGSRGGMLGIASDAEHIIRCDFPLNDPRSDTLGWKLVATATCTKRSSHEQYKIQVPCVVVRGRSILDYLHEQSEKRSREDSSDEDAPSAKRGKT